jgi:hypothetical protein
LKIRLIYLSWRKGRGSRCKIVGELKRTASDGIVFKYIKEGVDEAKKDGFNGYPGFPVEYGKVYREDNLDIFSLRLLPADRSDSLKYFRFWEIEGITDKFDILALTQGLLPTDNFEFLGLFNPDKGFKFTSDLSGLTHLELESDTLKAGDVLTYEKEFNEFAHKKTAVKVFKSNTHVGYIKNIHNHIFISTDRRLRIVVKNVEQNGIIKQVFVSIEVPKH